jgi:hypothetical protein
MWSLWHCAQGLWGGRCGLLLTPGQLISALFEGFTGPLEAFVSFSLFS